jgi:hypothetical protein
MALGLVVAQFTLPRRFGFAPLLIAICHFQNVPVIEVGGAFSAAKLVIVAEFARTDPCEKRTDPTAPRPTAHGHGAAARAWFFLKASISRTG